MLSLLLSLVSPSNPAPPLQYHLLTKATVDVMGTPVVLSMSAYVTITVTDSSYGHVASIAIDSSTFDGGQMGAMLAGQAGAGATGVTLRAFYANGKISDVTASSDNMQAMTLVPAIQLLLSATRSAKAGESWVDSVGADTTTAATQMMRANLVTAWKASAGQGDALQLDGTVTGVTAFGNGTMQAEIPTTGTSHATGRPGQLPTLATSTRAGQGSMNVGAQALPLKVGTEMSATLIR
jgi:hypothetical protein